MGFGALGSGFSEGLGQGVSLYNALKSQPLQRQQLQQEIAGQNTQNQLAQAQLGQYRNLQPFTLPNGQTLELPNSQAAQLGEQLAGQQAYANALTGRVMLGQTYKAGELDKNEQTRLDATKSAIPVHNAAMALYQAYQVANPQDGQQSDPRAITTAMTQLKQALSGNKLTAPYAQQIGNNPANIPAVYNAVVMQGAMEQPRLATGTIYVPGMNEINDFKNNLYPALNASPDVAYGMFKHFSDAYIEPPFQAAESKFQQASDGNGNFLNPVIANQYKQVVKQHSDANNSLYQLPGMGPQGSPLPEIRSILPAGGSGGVLRSAPNGGMGSAAPQYVAGTAIPALAMPSGFSSATPALPTMPGSVPQGQQPSPKRYQVLSVAGGI